jgi:hypothetical protein
MNIQEDRRFFINQYLKTLPLNALSMGIKFLISGAWVALENAKLLGFYSLASSPSAISQRAAVAAALLRTTLPVVNDKRNQALIIQTAMLTDLTVLCASAVILSAFFLITRASIVTNLGLWLFLAANFAASLESVPSAAIHVCNAKRHYGWNFLLSNFRLLVTLLGLLLIYATKKTDARLGAWVWGGSVVSTLFLALLYFKSSGISLGRQGGQWLQPEFLKNLKRSTHHLILYRVSILIFGALPSMFLAFMEKTSDAGLFAFAMTLSGFLYAAIAPVNEQIYSPTFSVLVQSEQKPALMRRLYQMSATTVLLTGLGSVALLLGGPSLLRAVGKLTFLQSFGFLPVLLVYYSVMLVFSGFTFSLFCMNRFKALISIDVLAIAAAVIWFSIFRGTTRVYWCLPLSSALEGLLSAIYVYRLSVMHAPLVRRTIIPVMA